MKRNYLIIVSFGFLGAVTAYFLNLGVLDKILIPDPCYYHSHDTNLLIELFYKMTATEGFHPTPSNLNLLITYNIGAGLGTVFALNRIHSYKYISKI